MGWDQKSAMVEVVSGHGLDLDLDMDTFDDVFLPFLLVATTRKEKAHAEILLSKIVKGNGKSARFGALPKRQGLLKFWVNTNI